MENVFYIEEYCERLDMTIIFKYSLVNDATIEKISGFYYGKPSKEATEQFKEKNYMITEKDLYNDIKNELKVGEYYE